MSTTLAEKIQKMQSEFMKGVPENVLKTMQEGMKEIIAQDIEKKSLKEGDTIPFFSLPNAYGRVITIGDLLARGPIVISFYRGQWCPYCNLELPALQEVVPVLQKLGASLVAISPNLPDNTLSSVKKHSLGFEVLSDIGNRVAKQFGIVFTLPESLRAVYKDFGIDIPGSNGDDTYTLPLPATFIVDQKGFIRHAFVKSDYTKRMEPQDILSAVTAVNGAVQKEDTFARR